MAAYRLEVQELAEANERAVAPFEAGELCVFCGGRFAEAHGELVACERCREAHQGPELEGIQPATHPIVGSAEYAYGRIKGRKRR